MWPVQPSFLFFVVFFLFTFLCYNFYLLPNTFSPALPYPHGFCWWQHAISDVVDSMRLTSNLLPMLRTPSSFYIQTFSTCVFLEHFTDMKFVVFCTLHDTFSQQHSKQDRKKKLCWLSKMFCILSLFASR